MEGDIPRLEIAFVSERGDKKRDENKILKTALSRGSLEGLLYKKELYCNNSA
jgi:hypothetical protein